MPQDQKSRLRGILRSCLPPVLVRASAADAAGSLSAALDRKSAPVGEVATLTLSYQLPAGGTLPDPPAVGGLEGLTILGREAGPGTVTVRVLVDQLEALKTGAIALAWLDKDAKPNKLYADSVVAPGRLRPRGEAGRSPAAAAAGHRAGAAALAALRALGPGRSGAGAGGRGPVLVVEEAAAAARDRRPQGGRRTSGRRGRSSASRPRRSSRRGRSRTSTSASRRSCGAISRPSGGSRRPSTPSRRSRGTSRRSRTGSCWSCCGRRTWSSSPTPPRRPRARTRSCRRPWRTSAPPPRRRSAQPAGAAPQGARR